MFFKRHIAAQEGTNRNYLQDERTLRLAGHISQDYPHAEVVLPDER